MSGLTIQSLPHWRIGNLKPSNFAAMTCPQGTAINGMLHQVVPVASFNFRKFFAVDVGTAAICVNAHASLQPAVPGARACAVWCWGCWDALQAPLDAGLQWRST